MYSCPGETSTGTMCPGSLVANATSPAAPTARYSVMKIEPPPATRFSTPNRPPPPANWVWVVIWMELPIQESSPASEMTDSLGSRTNSNTGIVVPVMRDCIGAPMMAMLCFENESALDDKLRLNCVCHSFVLACLVLEPIFDPFFHSFLELFSFFIQIATVKCHVIVWINANVEAEPH